MSTKRSRVGGAVATAVMVLGATFSAQPAMARDLGSFRIEVRSRTWARTPAVEGYVYNDGPYVLTAVRLKVEVVGTDGKTMMETYG